MTSKHTPGPWALLSEAPDCAWVEDADGKIVATGFGRDAKGNARLIAEAPAMLEALRKAQNAYNQRNPVGKEIRAILARIDGE